MNSLSRRNILKIGALWTMGSWVNRGMANPIPPHHQEIDRFIAQYAKKYNVPGLTLCFMKDNNVVYSQAWGLANRKRLIPTSKQSLFRIASNSKAFTSTAIFLLIEAGKLKLTDTVFGPNGILSQYSYTSQPQDWVTTITVHQLLTHTGGGWGKEINDPMFEKPHLNHHELIQWTLNTHKLEYPPGQHYDYSNFGYCLLGRVIEQVTSQPYHTFVHQHILSKIGSADMRIGTNETAPKEVTYYSQEEIKAYSMPIARMDSHGGWIARSEDMAQLMTQLFIPLDNPGTAGLLSKESLATMTQGSTANSEYACGLAVNSAGTAWHDGSLPGTTSIMVHTKNGHCWAGVLNTRTTTPTQISDFDALLWNIASLLPNWKMD